MINVTNKPITLRKATAEGFIKIQDGTAAHIKNNTLPKGNLFDVARAAGLLGAKNTHNLIPHCHPVSIDHLEIQFEVIDTTVKITAEGASIARTGIEMEVLTAVSIAALTIYDLLKPVDKNIEIQSIKLANKKGGRKSHNKDQYKNITAAVLVVSDSTAAGTRQDKSGKIIEQMVTDYGVEIADYIIVPDEPAQIEEALKQWVAKDIQFIFTTGGTGLGPRDITVDTIEKLADKKIQGIAEAMHKHGQERTLKAMLSRSFACVIQKTTVVCLPGSSAGARESLEAILPELFHARSMIEGGGH